VIANRLRAVRLCGPLRIFAASALKRKLSAAWLSGINEGKGNAEFAESQRAAEKRESKIHDLKATADAQTP